MKPDPRPDLWADFWPELAQAPWKAMGENRSKVYLQGKWYIFKLHSPLNRKNFPCLATIYTQCAQAGLSPRMLLHSQRGFLACKNGAMASLQELIPQAQNPPPCPQVLGKALARLHQQLSQIRLGKTMKNHLQHRTGELSAILGEFREWRKFEPLIKETESFLRSQPSQVLHGDLHRANILSNGKKILFIDFDSAFFGPAIWDIAFCAWRIYGPKKKQINTFIQVYNEENPSCQIAIQWLGPITAHALLQRIAFILLEERAGRLQWSSDLPKLIAILEQLCQHHKVSLINDLVFSKV